ncbi:unnamed protein product [Dovyalis caffra]|uniref:Uncharacterized protein n=1 Tax=Dovyalis caffra TaxID=77055 RepID=A0AAV1SRX3_9ROSI|nr:unnamed protein product [Dovyalis caffra]
MPMPTPTLTYPTLSKDHGTLLTDATGCRNVVEALQYATLTRPSMVKFLADALTKSLSRARFKFLRDKFRILSKECSA